MSFLSRKTAKEGFVGIDDIAISIGKYIMAILFVQYGFQCRNMNLLTYATSFESDQPAY